MTDVVKVIEIKKSIFEDNEKDANALRAELKRKGVFLLNLMSSPGSGKTTTLIRTIGLLKDKLRMAVMEADIDSDVDARKIKEATGIPSIQHEIQRSLACDGVHLILEDAGEAPILGGFGGHLDLPRDAVRDFPHKLDELGIRVFVAKVLGDKFG